MGEKQQKKRFAIIRVKKYISAKKRQFLFSDVCIAYFGLFKKPLMFADFPSLSVPRRLSSHQ